ncbi:MAG: S8 family peptidase [Acidimicrobiales bacterium]
MSTAWRTLSAATLTLAVAGAAMLTSASPAGAHANPEAQPEVVVKVDVAGGHTIEEVNATFATETDSAVLASRGIYLVRSTDPRYSGEANKADELADHMAKSPAVIYAEPNVVEDIADNRFHAWPTGAPDDAGTDPAVWADQPATAQLQLDAAHAQSQGAGVTVAVLDTGVDPDHPALAGRLLPTWDYVDDDDDARDVAEGVDDDGDGQIDEAFGHGTFVSGVVALVAPEATILPARVLNSDGRGHVFVVAEAILDAADAGADVINLSFGTAQKLRSHLLDDAIREAQHQGVVVVAAAGNDGSDADRWPAANPEVVGVSALAEDATGMAGFANSGGSVDVAAPGEHVAGPVPGGRYAWWSGTSVATPFVAGQVALIRAHAPGAEAKTIAEAVTHTTTKLHPKDQPEARAINIVASLTFLD